MKKASDVQVRTYLPGERVQLTFKEEVFAVFVPVREIFGTHASFGDFLSCGSSDFTDYKL